MTKKAKRGRPPSGRIQDTPFMMRTSAEFLEMVDDWRRKQSPIPSRSQAVRRLVEMAVKGKGEK